MSGTPLHNAARIANIRQPVDLDSFSEEELREAGRCLMKQKVSLVGLFDVYGEEMIRTPLADFLEADRAKFQRERDEFERIRERLVADGIDAMLFKSAGMKPSFHYLSSNLDVIFRDGDADAVRAHLVALGYVELVNVEEPKKFLFRRFPGDGTTFAFHLHEQVGWGVPFLDNDRLWKNARTMDDDPDILIPGPTEALLVTLGHWFYEDKELSLANMFMTAQALTDMTDGLDVAAGHAAERGWAEGYWGALHVFDETWRRFYCEPFLRPEQRAEVDEALRSHAFVREMLLPAVVFPDKTPATIPFMMNKVVYYQKILSDKRRSALSKFEDVVATLLWAVRWKLHIRSQKPVMVSISGVDGSGKSVQVERLQYVFDTCDLRNKTIWARGASSRMAGLAIKLGKLLMRRPGDSSRGSVTAETEDDRFKERQSSLAGRPLRTFVFAKLFALDLLWPYVIKPRLLMMVGNLVICDRYVYDALVDFSLYSGCAMEDLPLPLRLLERWAPTPHVAVLLDVEPKEALRRKPEEGSTGHLEVARNAFVSIAEKRGLAIMPTDASKEEIAGRISRMALDQFYDGYGTLLNGLLYSNPDQLNPRHG